MKFTINVEQLIMTTTHRLKKNGNFEMFSENPSLLLDDDFTFDSYLEAEHWKQSLSTIAVNGVEIDPNSDGFSIGDPIVTIRSHRINKPKQTVFTREQLRSVLLNGDDSVHNSLIVDKEGYIQIVPFDEAIVAGYPVRFETFDAGNGYVGSVYETDELEDLYMTLLEGWAEHLASGDSVYRDYSTGENEEDLLKEIEVQIQKYQ